jgi:hypothetical protein
MHSRHTYEMQGKMHRTFYFERSVLRHVSTWYLAGNIVHDAVWTTNSTG